MSEQFRTILERLRQHRGYTQLRVAEGLCAVSGVDTVTRQDVSWWERGECAPSAYWLPWLAVVLEVTVEELEAAVTAGERGCPGLRRST